MREGLGEQEKREGEEPKWPRVPGMEPKWKTLDQVTGLYGKEKLRKGSKDEGLKRFRMGWGREVLRRARAL